MEPDERRLSAVMKEAVDGVRPPLPSLVDGATVRGLRLRRRRRAVQAASLCAVAAALAAGVSVFGAYLPTMGSGAVVQALPEAPADGSDEVAFPDFSHLPRDPEPPEDKVALTGRATVHILRELLPAGTGTSHYKGQDSFPPGPAYVDTSGILKIATGVGRAEVTVNVQGGFGRDRGARGTEFLERFYSCDENRGEGRMTACTVTNLDDGSVLMAYEDRSGLLIRRHADLLRTDGTRIVVGTSNGWDLEDGPVLASRPPLSFEALRAVVTSSRWSQWVAPDVVEAAKALTPYRDLTPRPAPGDTDQTGRLP
ncbi:hypothetical protein ACLIYM_22490 [Streptomyces fenghuangensis]